MWYIFFVSNLIFASFFNQPHLAEYQRKQKERFVPITLSQNEPIFKKAKRSDSVEPLEDCLTSKLPELPDDLKKKQHDIEISAGYRQPTPPKKEAQRPKSNHQRHGRYTVGAHQIDSDFLDKIIESELSDPLAILKLIRNHSNIGFLYMTTAVDKSSINYNPYNVKCVVFSWFRYLCCFQDLFFIQNLRKIVNWW